MLVVLSTVVAFILAVVAINQETPEGASPNHFTPDPNPHRLIGLVIFIIAAPSIMISRGGEVQHYLQSRRRGVGEGGSNGSHR